MSTTNMQATQNPVTGHEKLSFSRRYIAALTTGLRNNGHNNVPVTARGRALYTIDCFLNGKPVLRNHDKSRAGLRNRFAS